MSSENLNGPLFYVLKSADGNNVNYKILLADKQHRYDSGDKAKELAHLYSTILTALGDPKLMCTSTKNANSLENPALLESETHYKTNSDYLIMARFVGIWKETEPNVSPVVRDMKSSLENLVLETDSKDTQTHDIIEKVIKNYNRSLD